MSASKKPRGGEDFPPNPDAVRLEDDLYALADGEGGVDFYEDPSCRIESERTGIAARWWPLLERARGDR